jgi:glycerol-3-phosphate dehydrogenase subunit C
MLFIGFRRHYMGVSKNISYQPTDGLSYDTEEDIYWNENALKGEIQRVFEVCHGCRMCFKYCDSFPSLFKFIDNEVDGDVTKLNDNQINNVFEQCFQCKLCEVQCPYTPRDNHEFQLDFPKLVHRYNAIKTKKHGVKLRDKILASVDKLGVIIRATFGIVNKINKNKLNRFFMEKTIGIHRHKLLPSFANETFEKWAEKNNKMNINEKTEVGLFQTCYVQNNEPEIGKDTVEVYEKNEINITCIKDLKCCGMPSWEHGDLDTVRENARHNLDILEPLVKKGIKIIAINPTCSMMMRREYMELLGKEDRKRAKLLSENIQDTGEYLWSIRKEDRFNTDFQSSPDTPVGYHTPCHLRAQAVGFKGRDLLRKIPGVVPKMVMECCGHDGTYAMKKESFDASKRIGKKSFDGIQNTKSEIWSTECPLAATQFEQHAGKKPMHPMSILAKAYKKDGFQKVIG